MWALGAYLPSRCVSLCVCFFCAVERQYSLWLWIIKKTLKAIQAVALPWKILLLFFLRWVERLLFSVIVQTCRFSRFSKLLTPRGRQVQFFPHLIPANLLSFCHAEASETVVPLSQIFTQIFHVSCQCASMLGCPAGSCDVELEDVSMQHGLTARAACFDCTYRCAKYTLIALIFYICVWCLSAKATPRRAPRHNSRTP